MTDDAAKPKPILPMLIIGLGGLILLVVIYFWATSEDEIPTMEKPTPVPVAPQVETESPLIEEEPIDEPEEFEPIAEPEPLPEPEPLDISDSAVKTAIITTADYEAAANLLVDEALLERFVVSTVNIARGDVAPNHRFVKPPEQSFRVYQQAGKEWIDAASYKRYTPYVEALESIDSEQLINLYEKYKPRLQEMYAEIGDPDEGFDMTLKEAIDHLLNTPSVPVPVEVYTDSVMYKYKDERLESLTEPQKQLLRMGPENMRRVKAKLREVKELL